MQLLREPIAQYDVFFASSNCALMNSTGPNLNFANVCGTVDPSSVVDLIIRGIKPVFERRDPKYLITRIYLLS